MAKVYDNPESYDNGDMTFKEKMEHIWFHYKWVIVSVTVLVVFLGVALVQFLQNKNPDVDIMHVGPMYLSPTATEKMQETVAGFSEDYNDDGEIKVNILDITIGKTGMDTDATLDDFIIDSNAEGYKRFQTEIRTGDAVIYLLEEMYFQICVDEGLLTPFSEIIDEEFMPENVIDGCGVRISELDAHSLPGLSAVPENAILCIRRSPNKDQITYGRSAQEWEDNAKTFLNIIKYRGE